MRSANNAKLSHQDEQCGSERKGASPFVRNTASVLTIPRLSQNIQTKFNSGKNAKNMANLALNLIRKGYIDEKATGELTQLVKEGIQKWILSCAGQLKHFDLAIELTADLNHLQNSMYDEDFVEMESNLKEAAGESPICLLIETGELSVMTIGKQLQAIEDKTEGLGKTAYYWLATIGARNLEVFTPWMATHRAENVWWYGTDNQECFVEEVTQYYDDDDADSLENALSVSPEKWHAAFPEWVTNIEEPLSEADLNIIAQAEPSTLESEIATILLDMIKNKDASIPNANVTGMESIYSGLYLHWEDNDMSNQLADDWFEGVNQTGGEGYTESLCLTPIPSKPSKFNQWMEEMEAGFIQLKNIERLVNLIGTRTN